MVARKINVVLLVRSTRVGKKMTALVSGGSGAGSAGRMRTVHFGAVGYSDFTIHKDVARRDRYITRHRNREDWSLRGIYTPGFWSRWVLWNKPSLRASVHDIKRRFGGRVKVVVRSRVS